MEIVRLFSDQQIITGPYIITSMFCMEISLSYWSNNLCYIYLSILNMIW